MTNRQRGMSLAEVLVANDPRFSEPTLGAVVGDRFLFIRNSQWDRFDEQHRLPPAADKRRDLLRKVVRRRFERAQRGEVLLQFRMDELIDMLGNREVFQSHATEIAQGR